MLMPSIFGENLFDDDWMNFPFNDEFWGKKNPLYGKHAQNMMKTDIRETNGSYELDVDLPGFKKDEIQVQLKDGYLVLSAAKGLDKDEKDKEGNYIRRERYAGSMCRSFYVGDAVSEEDIHAKYEDGILKLSTIIVQFHHTFHHFQLQNVFIWQPPGSQYFIWLQFFMHNTIFFCHLFHMRALQNLQKSKLKLLGTKCINIIEGPVKAVIILIRKTSDQIQMLVDIPETVYSSNGSFQFIQIHMTVNGMNGIRIGRLNTDFQLNQSWTHMAHKFHFIFSQKIC